MGGGGLVGSVCSESGTRVTKGGQECEQSMLGRPGLESLYCGDCVCVCVCVCVCACVCFCMCVSLH